jgi:hypothetical protein
MDNRDGLLSRPERTAVSFWLAGRRIGCRRGRGSGCAGMSPGDGRLTECDVVIQSVLSVRDRHRTVPHYHRHAVMCLISAKWVSVAFRIGKLN